MHLFLRGRPHAVSDFLEELFFVLNSSVNFFLYFASSKVFRCELKKYLQKTRDEEAEKKEAENGGKETELRTTTSGTETREDVN